MRIHVHAKGGMSVYGGHYDPHRNEAIVQARDDAESVACVIEYDSAPTSPSKTASNLTCSTPTVSGSKVSCTLSAMNDGGYVDVAATVGGATKVVRIRAKTQQFPDLYESGAESV
jgi:hypothetical protein